MSLNFAEIASKKMNEIEKPPLPPVGTYRWKISKLPEVNTSANGEWDILTINVRAVEALDDVDVGAYPGEITSIMQSVRFMFNKQDEAEFLRTLDRVKTFFTKHVKCAGDEDDIKVAMNNSVGQEFLGSIAWKQDRDDADLFHANIGKTAPLD